MAIKDLLKINRDHEVTNTGGGNGNGNGNVSQLPVKSESGPLGYSPTLFRDMDEWFERWNRWFDSFFGPSFSRSALSPFRSFEPTLPALPGGLGTFVPAVNVSETDKELRVTAELPGLDENDIDVSISGNSLILKGEKKNEFEERGRNYYRMERSYGAFHRAIPLPEGTDTNNVEANFSKGVLTVTLPKLPEYQAGARKIAIKTEGK